MVGLFLPVSACDERSVVGTCAVTFKCPKCQEANEVDVFRFETVSELTVYGTLPETVCYESTLKCPNCEVTFRTNLSLNALQKLSPDKLSDQFRVRIGFIEKFFVIAGWVVVCVGPVALLVFIVAICMVPRAASGWRVASVLGAIVSLLSTLLWVIY